MKRYIFTLLLLVTIGGMMASELVYTPTLKSPLNGATNQMPNVPLTWNAITGSTGLQYELMLDTSASFNSPSKFDTVQTLLAGYITRNLLFGQVYYWKVRAIDNGNTSAWSPSRNFTVFSYLEIDGNSGITPPKPAIGDSNENPDVSVYWKSTVNFITIKGVSYYDYQVDTSSNFNSPLLVSGSVQSNVFSFKNHNLRFSTIYYWRVRPRHVASVGPWNPTLWYFRVLRKPTLVTPANNATNQSLNVTLKWNNNPTSGPPAPIITGVLAFQFQIALDQNFTTIIDASETQTNIDTADFLRFAGSYYWRVRARHLTDTSDWSAAFHFTVNSTVTLFSPANNAQNVIYKPTLTWVKQTGLTGYQLELDSDNTFANPIVNYKPKAGDGNYQLIKTLKPLKTYYWRMRAFANTGITADTSAWSTVWSFTTQGPTGIEENPNSSFVLYPNPTSGKIFIRMDSRESLSVSFSLFDMVGKIVVEKELNFPAGQSIQEINLDNTGEGVYIGHLNFGQSSVNQKIIIKR